MNKNPMFTRSLRGLKRGLFLSGMIGLSLTGAGQAAPTAEVQLKVDWPNFMARNDLVWEQMPTSYFEGPFQGNGMLGTVFFLDDEAKNTLRFEIGRTDVYDPRHSAGGGKFTSNFQTYDVRLPIGQLPLEPVGRITVAQCSNAWCVKN